MAGTPYEVETRKAFSYNALMADRMIRMIMTAYRTINTLTAVDKKKPANNILIGRLLYDQSEFLALE